MANMRSGRFTSTGPTRFR